MFQIRALKNSIIFMYQTQQMHIDRMFIIVIMFITYYYDKHISSICICWFVI